MELDKIGLSIASAVGSFGVGSGEIPIPPNLPLWLAALIAAIGPAAVAFLSWIGHSSVVIVASYFRKKAELKKKKAEDMLKDKDKSNDIEALKLLATAEAELAAAKKAEDIAMKNTRKE